MTLDAELLEILVCPNDRGDVDYLEDEQVIVCRTCGYRYPVRDGIPVMLIDEAEQARRTVRARDPWPSREASRRPNREARRDDVDLDDARAVREQDPGGMLAAVAALGSHCREGYANGAEAKGLPDLADVRGVVFCGMGGSAVAGDVLRSVFRDRLGVPVEVNRSPELPEHAGPHSLVVASSYSGNTSETLARVPRIHEARLPGDRRELGRDDRGRGGRCRHPRRGRARRFPAARRAGLARVHFARRAGSRRPAAAVGRRRRRGGGEADARAAACGPDVAHRATIRRSDSRRRSASGSPSIWGAEGIGAVAAARWKTQCNENGKVPAWWASMSELDHNEVVGWTEPFGRAHTVIALRHEAEDPEIAARFPLSLQIAADAGAGHPRGLGDGSERARSAAVADRARGLLERLRRDPQGRRSDAGRRDPAAEGRARLVTEPNRPVAGGRCRGGDRPGDPGAHGHPTGGRRRPRLRARRRDRGRLGTRRFGRAARDPLRRAAGFPTSDGARTRRQALARDDRRPPCRDLPGSHPLLRGPSDAARVDHDARLPRLWARGRWCCRRRSAASIRRSREDRWWSFAITST